MPDLTGVLLVQLGTPDSAEVRDVRRYLEEFLSDRRVLDLPAPLRWILLRAVILPFRPRRSAEAYEKIWTDRGSPLLLHTEALASGVAERLGSRFRTEIGMRYQHPSIEAGVTKLLAAGVERIVVLPLFPQYSSAATGSALEKVLEEVGSGWNVPPVTTLGDFYAYPGFTEAVAGVAEPLLRDFQPEHVLFSYHGLPERQIRRSDPTGSWCLQIDSCCDAVGEVNRYCYRAQCFATTKAVAERLGLDEDRYSTSFQSRLAGTPWIKPFTDRVLPELRSTGVSRLAVLTPSFVADCLETLEEIGIRGRDQWLELGGEDFLAVPCVNADRRWVEAVATMVEAL